MDFSAGSSSSSISKFLYSQPYDNQSKVHESSQKDLGNNVISFPVISNNLDTFPDNEIIVLSSSDSEVELELNSTNNKPIAFNKDKGKEREHSTDPKFGTISSAVNLNTVRLNESNLFGISNYSLAYDKGKKKEREEDSLNTTISSAGLNITQIDDSDDELVDMEIDYDIPQSVTTVSNQLKPWTIDTGLGPAVNNSPKGQQTSCVEKVIKFFKLYNYTFDIFDIVIDLSNKYQEIFQGDSAYLQPYHNNPCVLLELLSNLLSKRLNSDVHGTDFINLESLATEYYEKLKRAEIERQGLYRTTFHSNNFHSTAKSLNGEKMLVVNSQIGSNLPVIKCEKTKNKKIKKSKPPNGPKVDLEKILSSAVQLPENKIETKPPPLSIAEHLNKFVFNQGGFINSITQSTNNLSLNGNSNFSISPQQTFNSPIFPTFNNNFSDNQTVQAVASTSSNIGKHTVEVVEPNSQPTTTTSHKIDPNPPSNHEIEITEYNIRRHVPHEEWPIPDLSFEADKEYKRMMADAIQKLAITNLAMKHNPESGPGELDSIVNKFKIKKIAKDSGSALTYNETLINIFNHGGMDMVMERLEGNISSHLKVKPKENRKQRKKRRLMQKQSKGECCGKKNGNY
ncbi:hypothetical protein RclHR1_07250010 [Rhizophagus clarus]|uniref:Uncharacterized protein n=1 Tax=Rhizophagus clarus TaxID=94130 RepID=A0A2Z6RVF7_9GLOM|nr:hypothetical protein RclHR1_07250010 [Rhizophagus clarus]GES97700.1 hypothetical protein GLOIN_2v1518913 [Rhizophagus clarus]